MNTAGFEAAFRTLFAQRSASLYRYLSRLCGDPALAEDTVQECFVRLYRRGTMPDDPAAWLATVAHNLLRDEQRRDARQQRLLVEQAARVPAANPSATPDEAMLAAERIAAVRTALARVPVRDRALLLLRHEGYTYREIARVLNVAASGVGTMLVRATEAFRKAYDGVDGASH